VSYKKYPNAYATKPPRTEKKVQLITEKKFYFYYSSILVLVISQVVKEKKILSMKDIIDKTNWEYFD